MSRTHFTLLAVLALATCLAVAQEQQPAQSQPGQTQPIPQTQQPPQPQQQPGQTQPMPQTHPQPQQQPPAAQGQAQGQKGMSSQDLQAAFQRTFQKYPELSDLKVKVADDKIELSGTVPSQVDKDKVRRTAENNADGRKVVDDELKVSGGESKPSSPPPPSTPPR